jgi:hypothetical protein
VDLRRLLPTAALAVGLILLGTSGAAAVPGRSAAGSQSAPASTSTVATPGHPIVLAHFYLWFDPTSWNRAKVDYPLAGRYSSDDATVMRNQVRQAKSAGITGFIVSWKSTPLLDRRLKQLVAIAEDEKFQLAITYQGLTFDRVNLPASRVASDLDDFIDNYASSSVFNIFGKPLVVLTGTPGMSAADVASITAPRRDRLTILATEKNVAGYQRVANLVDGDLYYWSSVNPETYGGFSDKLAAMSDAVHSHNGLWIAPVSPGFDARLVGGTSIVSRDKGSTFRTEWNAALASQPDAIGVISWNEYSENTYIEPSKEYGDQYLKELRALTGAQPPTVQNFDSSAPSGGATSPWRSVMVLIGAVVLLGACSIVAVRRRRIPA